MLANYSHWLVRRRWFVIFISLFICLFFSLGLKNLEFTNDYRAFFSKSNPERLAFDQMQTSYSKTDNVLFIITPEDGQVFSLHSLKAVQWLTEEAWKIPYSSRVESVTNFQHTYAEDDDLTVEDLVGDLKGLSPNDLYQLKSIATSESSLIKRLINSDASVTGVNVSFQLPGKSLKEVPEVANYSRNLANEIREKSPGIRVDLTGVIMLNDTFDSESAGDMKRLLPIMFACVVLIIWLMLRSVSALIITLIVIVLATFIAMGAFGWSGIKMTAPMTTVPTVILTVAVADAVHMFVTFLAYQRLGKSKTESLVESLRVNFFPVTITSILTVIGFLTMNFSDSPPLAHLGNTVAVGVLSAWWLSLFLLPALVMVMPFNIRASDKASVAHNVFDTLSAFTIRYRRGILITTAVLTLIALWLAPKNEINDQFVDYFDPDVEFRKSTDYAGRVLLGPYSLDVSIETNQENGIADPEFLKKVESFAVFSSGQTEVSHVFSAADMFKRLNKNMHGDEPQEYRLPSTKDLASQYLLMYEMSLPFGMDLTNQINLDKSATRVTLALKNVSSKEILALEQRIIAWFVKNHPELQVKVASTTSIFAHIGQRNASYQTVGVAVSLFLISMILIVVMRSVKIGIVSLVPNLVPIVMAFGIWAVIDGEIGITLAITAGMTLGIVVDDTVHYISKYMRAKRETGCGAEEAIRVAFHQVGPALFSTTVILVAGFSILLFSQFKLNADLGLMASITISLALLLDFLALPALLVHVDGDKEIAKTMDKQMDSNSNPGFI